MGFKGSKVQILSSRPESRNPKGSTETWIPFLFLGSALSLFPVFRLAGHFAKPDHTGQTFPAVPRIMGMVSALADLADSRQIHCPQSEPPAKRVVCSGPVRACYRLRLKTLAFTLFKPSALASLATP